MPFDMNFDIDELLDGEVVIGPLHINVLKNTTYNWGKENAKPVYVTTMWSDSVSVGCNLYKADIKKLRDFFDRILKVL